MISNCIKVRFAILGVFIGATFHTTSLPPHLRCQTAQLSSHLHARQESGGHLLPHDQFHRLSNLERTSRRGYVCGDASTVNFAPPSANPASAACRLGPIAGYGPHAICTRRFSVTLDSVQTCTQSENLHTPQPADASFFRRRGGEGINK